MQIVTKTSDTLSALLSDPDLAEAQFVSIHGNCADGIGAAARSLPEGPALHGATSCLGAMTDTGATSGWAAFAINDPDGAYGTACLPFDADGARSTAQRATRAALLAADRVGERPDLVWISATPGTEEAVLAGIADAVGSDVPTIGGSAADNSVEGNWFVFDSQTQSADGVVISVLFPSTPVSFAYQSGYSPTQASGVVTAGDGRRIFAIDGRPAMDVYRDWTGGHVPAATDGATAILSDSTLWPLGRAVSDVGGVPFYLLAHPATAHPDGSIDLFADVAVGERLTSMTGTKDSLIDRAGRVAGLARATNDAGPDAIAGALMIYCGGCMLSLNGRLGDVVDGVNNALGGAPFAGAFTFGEQGTLLDAGNRHGNLMISCIVFGR